MTVFVDTSIFYAGADDGDRANARAAEILLSGERLVSTDHVLVETWLLLARRLGRHAAQQHWEAIKDGAATLEFITPADLAVAFAIGDAFPDQDFSIVDRTSFAVMERLGVFRVATLDDHFAVYRFGRDRSRAFEIVR